MLHTAASAALLILGYVTVWFVIGMLRRRNDVADIAWGSGFVVLCVFFFFMRPFSAIAMIVYALIVLWGFGYRSTLPGEVLANRKIFATVNGARPGVNGLCCALTYRYICITRLLYAAYSNAYFDCCRSGIQSYPGRHDSRNRAVGDWFFI